jgi:ATP-binding cassette subfamily B protein
MLRVEQAQTSGATLINEMKNILILYVSAGLVVDGSITIGMMLAVQYILGQANQPVYQSVRFFQEAQMAVMSLRRLSEINELPSEFEKEETKVDFLPEKKDISFNSVHFKYEKPRGGKETKTILKNINLTIPYGKATCILGPSGCGKSTLLKLLLKLYHPSKGEIRVGDLRLTNMQTKWWRSLCGAIIHESALFNATVINNIVPPGEPVDMKRLLNAVRLAVIKEDIEQLPSQYETKLGPEGFKMSQGQKQRILIARLIYKNPSFILLDEATNALDAGTEATVLENLLTFFKNKTIIIVTHKLYTIKYVDNVMVMDGGEIVEFGEPKELVERKGRYYNMINTINAGEKEQSEF